MNNSLFRSDEEFIKIYNRNFNNVYSICYLILKNSHDAEDITQNVFLKLYNSSVEFKDENHEKGWLILTAKNMSINSIKHWNAKILSLFENDEPRYLDNKDETLEQVLKLNDKYKVVIYMHYYMGYKTNEISQILHIKESTIRSNLLRGRKKLKMLLEENE